MKIPDPVGIGYSARGEPRLVGLLSGHDLPLDMIVGEEIVVRGHRFGLSVSYVPANPKRETLVPILVPREELAENFWGGSVKKMVSIKKKFPTSQEEWPF